MAWCLYRAVFHGAVVGGWGGLANQPLTLPLASYTWTTLGICRPTSPHLPATHSAWATLCRCDNPAPSGEYCHVHEGHKRCKDESCNNLDKGGGKCISHGGGKRCKTEDCENLSVGGGLCIRHGGGKRCQEDGCKKADAGVGEEWVATVALCLLTYKACRQPPSYGLE